LLSPAHHEKRLAPGQSLDKEESKELLKRITWELGYLRNEAIRSMRTKGRAKVPGRILSVNLMCKFSLVETGFRSLGTALEASGPTGCRESLESMDLRGAVGAESAQVSSLLCREPPQSLCVLYAQPFSVIMEVHVLAAASGEMV